MNFKPINQSHQSIPNFKLIVCKIYWIPQHVETIGQLNGQYKAGCKKQMVQNSKLRYSCNL